jgi:hypothetical protein
MEEELRRLEALIKQKEEELRRMPASVDNSNAKRRAEEELRRLEALIRQKEEELRRIPTSADNSNAKRRAEEELRRLEALIRQKDDLLRLKNNELLKNGNKYLNEPRSDCSKYINEIRILKENEMRALEKLRALLSNFKNTEQDQEKISDEINKIKESILAMTNKVVNAVTVLPDGWVKTTEDIKNSEPEGYIYHSINNVWYRKLFNFDDWFRNRKVTYTIVDMSETDKIKYKYPNDPTDPNSSSNWVEITSEEHQKLDPIVTTFEKIYIDYNDPTTHKWFRRMITLGDPQLFNELKPILIEKNKERQKQYLETAVRSGL